MEDRLPLGDAEGRRLWVWIGVRGRQGARMESWWIFLFLGLWQEDKGTLLALALRDEGLKFLFFSAHNS